MELLWLSSWLAVKLAVYVSDACWTNDVFILYNIANTLDLFIFQCELYITDIFNQFNAF